MTKTTPFDRMDLTQLDYEGSTLVEYSTFTVLPDGTWSEYYNSDHVATTGT